MSTEETITVTDDGLTMPVVEVLTGRGFITGKSGSGKSNTASVVAEEILALSLPLLVVDTDGEYYGLKESFEMLHVGGDAECDVRVGVGHADQLAHLALEENVPIILDVSGYTDQDRGHAVIEAVVSALFHKEKSIRRPFLLLVEEMHEFVPETGGLGDVGETLVRVAKRGRKRGLGMVGMSQRPAAVDKDFITQCDWIVWHRLTWENDTKVAARILGGDADEEVQELDNGEAILMTDWDESTRRIQFRKKYTFDAGATPGLEDFDRPELESVDEDVLDALSDPEVDDGAENSQLVEDLQERLTDKDERIEELEAEVERLRAGSSTGESDAPDPEGAVSVGEAQETELEPRSDHDRGEPIVVSGTSSADAGPPPAPDDRNVLWEIGYLVVHLLRTILRRIAGAGRWIARTTTRGARGAVDWVRADEDSLPEETVALVLLVLVAVSIAAAAMLV